MKGKLKLSTATNKKPTKIKFKWVILIVCVFYASLICLISDKTFFYTNDDVLLDQIMSGRYSDNPSPIVSFTSQILGTFFAILYGLLPISISFFGITQILVGLISLICILYLIKLTENKLAKFIGIAICLVFTPQFILAPTFTITASISTATGIIGLVNCFIRRQNRFIFFVFLSLYIMGYLFRPDSFFLMNLIIVPGIAIHFYSNRKNLYFNQFSAYLTLTISIVTVLIDKLIFFYRQLSPSIKEYWDLQSLIINYNPASLILQQKIIAGEAMKNIWTNVDFIVLNNWAYVNKKVFSISNLQNSLIFVKDYRGLQGFFKSDPESVINNLFYIGLTQFQLGILISILILLILFSKNLMKFKNILIFQFCVNFILLYFLSATLRVPDRLFYSFMLATLFFIFLIILIDESSTSININNFFKYFLIVFTILFHLTDIFGIKNLLKLNNFKSEFQLLRQSELIKFSSNGTFIGPISYFSGNFQNSISFKNENSELSKRTILLSWANFSPSWNMQVNNSSLDQMNLLNSIAKKNHVYWISNSYLAEILNYHMNDHKIYRGKLCSLKKLKGNDNAEIFTYQAKENDC